MVKLVRPEEFYWQEAHYDHDSRQGRELLFLMANHEWVRATSEVVDVTRTDTIDTTIKVDVDLSQVTHEAFRTRSGPVWLPVAVLPPQATLPPQDEDIRFEPDLFATVTDAGGDPVPMLPAADLRHRVSAAMAEIIAKMAVSHLPSSNQDRPEARPGERRRGEDPGRAEALAVATRDERLLLSAAIYRLLRHEPGTDIDPDDERVVARDPRVSKARAALLGLLDYYVDRLALPSDGTGEAIENGTREHLFTPELARRAVKILLALAKSIIVVVLVDYDAAPSVLTVRVPARPLSVYKPSWIRPWTWVIRPAGRLQIDVLLPTADADRQIQLNLPEGVILDRSGAPPRLDIAVHAPLPLQDLSASVKQLIHANRRARQEIWPESLVRSMADLAREKAVLAVDTFRHYDAFYGDGPAPQAAAGQDKKQKPVKFLDELTEELERPDSEAPPDPQAAWLRFDVDRISLFRRIVTKPLSAQAVLARANMIENVSQRATPEHARMSLDITVDDRDYFSTARASAFMSLILMAGVLAFLYFWHTVNPKAAPPAPEVLAIVLTLFATIQADRIERPDRSSLRGLLYIGGWLIAASVLPALTLAVALAFQSNGRTAYFWAGGCIIAQLILLASMRRGPLTPAGWPHIGKRRVLSTARLDYRHFEALRSDYWRNTTAGALMLGREAHGYAVWQKANPERSAESISPKLRPLLAWDNGGPPTEAGSILGLLRSGTLRQAVTVVVFRGEPSQTWPRDAAYDGPATAGQGDFEDPSFSRRNLDLDPGQLAPSDSVTSVVDVFVGVDRHEILTVSGHPLTMILQAAANTLVVLDVQLPVPAPVRVYDDRQWARVRLALRDSLDISRLTGFLDEVCAEANKPANAGHIVAVQTVPSSTPRLITGTAAGAGDAGAGEDAEVPVLTSDLDIVNGPAIDGERADAPAWRVLAICADARSNIDSRMISRLALVRDQWQLAGLTYAVLYGTAVLILLVHEPATDREGERTGAASLEADLRRDPALAKLRVRVPVYRELSRADLEFGRGHTYPMLRARFRWQDRPGAILNVLDSINSVLVEELPSIEQKDWSIAYSRVQILTGQVGTGRLTIRMHIPPERIRHWNTARMEEMARKIENQAAKTAAQREGHPAHGDGADRPEEPVIGIARIKKPD